MIRRTILRNRFAALGVLVFLAGCAVKTAKPWGDPQTGLILQYRMPEGQVLKYTTSSLQVETGEVRGQSFEARLTGESTFAFRSLGRKDDDLQMEATIEALNMNSSAAGRDMSFDTSQAVGKSFLMTLSPLGRELDVTGAQAIQVSGPSGKQSMDSRFQTFFPDLAERPVKVGDSWTTEESLMIKSESGEVVIDLDNFHTLDGFESVDGMDCVRVKVDVSGKITGQGAEGPAKYSVSGDFKGTDIWYFAYKEGVFIKLTSEAHVDAVADVSEPQKMTIPTQQEMKIEVSLIK